MTETATDPIPRRDRSLIRAGIALAVGVWVAEGLLHALWLDPGEFEMGLFPSDANELWMRSVTTALILAFGLYSQRLHDRMLYAEAMRTAAERRLQDALRKVLSGYVTVCAWCKKILDDDGEWVTPETLAARQGTLISHGMCLECESSHHPDRA